MMGHGHATMGAAGWIAITGTTAGLGLLPMEPAQIAAGALITAGAALLPDADHHSGTIAHSLPPLSGLITRGVGQASGGHRHGTHSLIGVAVCFGLAWLLTPIRADLPWGLAQDYQIGAWFLSVLMIAFAAKALHLTRGWVTSWGFALIAASAAIYYAPEQVWWLPVAVGAGAAIHLLGDVLTIEGVPLLWPWRPSPPVRETIFWKDNGHFALPVLGHAGSMREWVMVMGLNIYVVAVLVETFSPGTIGALWSSV